MLSTTFDPDGRRVDLSEERWAHIKRRHPELSRHLGEVMRAVREPDGRRTGRKPFEEWFFLEWTSRDRRLRVVVHYEREVGAVWTAFMETAR